MTARRHPAHGFEYGPEELARLQRFSLDPVAPADIESRAADGEVLATLDVPGHLGRTLAVESGTGTALYRLTQLFGTPNVPGLAAGSDRPERERTTWGYLFEVTEEPAEGGPATTRLASVYDDRTDVSVGLSEWRAPEEPQGRAVLEPTDDASAFPDLPDEGSLVGLVQLVLTLVDEPVPAAAGDRWV